LGVEKVGHFSFHVGDDEITNKKEKRNDPPQRRYRNCAGDGNPD